MHLECEGMTIKVYEMSNLCSPRFRCLKFIQLHILWPKVWWLILWLYKFTGMPLGCVCIWTSRAQKLLQIYVLALCVAWFRNYMQSSNVNNIIKEVDFCRCITWLDVIHSIKLGQGRFPDYWPFWLLLTVHLCNCVWKISKAFILWHLCEGFGQLHDFINRAVFRTLVSSCGLLHLVYLMCSL